MKKPLLIISILAIGLIACGQVDQTFEKPIIAKQGVTYPDGKTQIQAFLGVSVSVADWNTMINKPLVFPPTTHNHDLLYKPITWKVDWNTDVLNKPTEIELITALPAMNYLPCHKKPPRR